MLKKKLFWQRPPKKFSITDERIEIITEPYTDLWQKTYYHFCNDNAPLLQMETEDKFFSFSVKTDFSESNTRFDQCGIVMYLDSENWLKASVEYENDWTMEENKLTGHLLIPFCGENRFDCCIEGNKMILAPADGVVNMMDPTKYLIKVPSTKPGN